MGEDKQVNLNNEYIETIHPENEDVDLNAGISEPLSEENLEYILQRAAREGEGDFPLSQEGLTYTQAEKIIDQMSDYQQLRMMYSCAIKGVRTKFDILNTEFSVRYQRNPINFITTRLKSTHSIMEKLRRRNKEFTIENMENCIDDIAGVRVICSYVDDIYNIAQELIAQDDIQLINEKDYIITPKPNGYRSLHLIVSIPVFFSDQKKNMHVEVQIRTIAMDFWASLEHGLRYKKNTTYQEEIVTKLKTCAEVISKTDMTMLDIRKKIEGEDAEQLSENDIEQIRLLEKLKRLETPFM